MKSTLIALLALILLILPSCQQSNTIIESSIPAMNENVPTAGIPGHVEIKRPELPWDTPLPEPAPSYEEYFSAVINYGYETLGTTPVDLNFIVGGNLPGFYLTYDGTSLYLESYESGRLWTIADIPNLEVLIYDINWIYVLVDNQLLLRMDYYGGSQEELFVDKTGLIAELNSRFILADDKVMYFFAGTEDGGVAIHRIYLPEMKTDVVYQYSEEELAKFYFPAPETYKHFWAEEHPTDLFHIGSCFPVSNHEVIWSGLNKEFYEVLNSLVANPDLNSKYFSSKDRELSEYISYVENDYGLYHRKDFYYNFQSKKYAEINTSARGGSGITWWKND